MKRKGKSERGRKKLSSRGTAPHRPLRGFSNESRTIARTTITPDFACDMLLRGHGGSSLIAIFMGRWPRKRSLPTTARQLDTWSPKTARNFSSEAQPPSSSQTESKPALHNFLKIFKESRESCFENLVLYFGGDTDTPEVNGIPMRSCVSQIKRQQSGLSYFYGFLGKRKDLSSDLSFARLVLPAKEGASIQLVATTTKAIQNGTKSEAGALSKLKDIRPWSAVRVHGSLKSKEMPKGGADILLDDPLRANTISDLEIVVQDIDCLSEFPEDITVNSKGSFLPEQRHLQLRFDRDLQKRLLFREFAVETLRRAAQDSDDLREVETPVLFKSTPEGAREFLVPTRRSGYAYALPQSPQQYKQMLMAGGFSGYFQFAKCFRDEDLRADRQPEFTQFDLELPFHNGISIRERVESIIWSLWYEARKKPSLGFVQKAPKLPIPCMTYHHTMTKYGTDKPDLRIPGAICQITEIIPTDLADALTSLRSPCFDAFSLRLNGDAQAARRFIKDFMESPEGIFVQENPDGAPGIFVCDPRKPLGGLEAFGYEGGESLKLMFPPSQPSDADIVGNMSAVSHEVSPTEGLKEAFVEGDVFVVQAREEPFSGGSTTTGRLRTALYKSAISAGLVDPDPNHRFLWVIDFPLFTPNNGVDPGQGGNSGFSATHHPFTSPKTSDDVDLLFKDPLKAIADHYDLVVNGVELGGGSMRIHNSEMQQFVMRDVLQISEERLKDFSHLLEALKDGCPPHAGFAIGIDRLVAIMTGVESVRDVIVFPKNGKGEDGFMKSPRLMTDEQLKTYHLKRAQS